MQSAQSIDRAAWLNKLALIGYIGSLVVVAILTFLSWWAGSHLQGVIQKDADARIAEADSKAAVANENAGKANERAGIANEAAAKANESAAKANERTEKLEGDNLGLRAQVATLETQAANAKKDVATLQKAAADAKAAQQRVETNLAEQQARAAKAEAELLQLQEAVKPRHLSAEKRAKFINFLRQSPKFAIEARCMDMEGCAFAKEIEDALREAGWEVRSRSGDVYAAMKTFFGIIVTQKNEGAPLPALYALSIALSGVGYKPQPAADPSQPDDVIILAIGAKP